MKSKDLPGNYNSQRKTSSDWAGRGGDELLRRNYQCNPANVNAILIIHL